MKTPAQILGEIHQHRPMTRAWLYKHLKALNIQPLGARQRPQRYPEDTSNRILAHLGFVNGNGNGGRLVTVPTLKKARAK